MYMILGHVDLLSAGPDVGRSEFKKQMYNLC